MTSAHDHRDQPVASWEVRAETRSAERVVRRASNRQVDIGRRLVRAATELLGETGDFGFTVKQVADRAGVALLTFYRCFETKDQLILAVIEESIRGAAASVERHAAALPDTLQRLRHVLTVPLSTMADGRASAGRAIVREHVRLTAEFADELEQAVEPYRSLLVRTLAAAVAAGELRSPDVERDATLIHRMIISLGVVSDGQLDSAHAMSAGEQTEYVWQFCFAGLNRGSPLGAAILTGRPQISS